MSILDLYHGSDHIVDFPMLGLGSINNDYGMGFYCTLYQKLAMEWACAKGRGGYANHYQLDSESLSILDLTKEDTLVWLSLLMANRTVRINYPGTRQALEWLRKKYLPDISKYDLIKGYRADDSYFSFARAFINGSISLNQLEKAMSLGDLGIQYVLKTQKAFDLIKYVDCVYAENSIYYPKKEARDLKARSDYDALELETNISEVRITDLMREMP